ncbi:MAG: HAMP domain-containing sensor histidine kinase [Verrucomicrobiota bacterium]
MSSDIKPSETPLADAPASLTVANVAHREQRLEAMKELVGHLAHSFNNSLAPLSGYVTLLGEEIKSGSPGEQYLKKFDSSIRRTQSLIESLVQATHPEKNFVPKEIDLARALERAVDTWRKNLPPNRKIVVTLAATSCSLFSDEAQWGKVFQQLLSNADQAMPRGGQLSISLSSRQPTAEEAAAFGLAQTNHWRLVFQDTGCGMAAEVLERACDPLFTTRPSTPATGLGLTLIHNVVRLHGGRLTIQSVPDEGTAVTIFLPGLDTGR